MYPTGYNPQDIIFRSPQDVILRPTTTPRWMSLAAVTQSCKNWVTQRSKRRDIKNAARRCQLSLARNTLIL